jgi:membrane associated rhomboid family serine protease
MIIPYRVDVPFNHRPVMNWLVVTGVIFVFFLQLSAISDPVASKKIYSFVLDGWGIRGLFGHMWLHAGFLHLIGNLIFLWLFGNAICSKLGNILYLPVYVGLGLISAISYLILDGRTMIGASGAIFGIVGMYLVFFPENSVSFMYFLFFPPFCIFRPLFFSISGYWLIILWFVLNIFGIVSGSEGVAYIAHIGGFLGGFGLAILMLKMKWIGLERDERSIFDILSPKKTNVPDMSREELEFWRRELKKKEKRKIHTVTPVEKPGTSTSKYIHFSCSCGQRIQVAKEYAGKIGRCPKCSKRIKIPEM